MTKFRFYHLERRRPEEALPALLEAARGARENVVVQVRDAEFVETLDNHLWTYSDESFLPHGGPGDPDPAGLPVYLTTGSENPNGARLRILLSGVALEETPSAYADYDSIVILFDGTDETARAGARAQWSALKSLGHSPTYWRQGEDGEWSPGR